jgi:hypothetical protein
MIRLLSRNDVTIFVVHKPRYVTLHYMVLVLPDVPRKTEVQLGRSKVVYDRVVLEYESTEDLVSAIMREKNLTGK